MLYKEYYTSPIGEMLLIARDNKLISCDFMTAKYYHHQKEAEARYEKVTVLSDTMPVFRVSHHNFLEVAF